MIKATIIQDSISDVGIRITTFELEYPRFVHAELMTHRMWSRNAESSRAVPIEKTIEHVKTNPAAPVFWGKNQAGMQSVVELEGNELQQAKSLWDRAATSAAGYSAQMAQASMHKQIANRVTEPFKNIKTIVTATEYANWYWLRDHYMAQPEIAELANLMKKAVQASTPLMLNSDEWHVPYVDRIRSQESLKYLGAEGYFISLEDAKIVSASCCAQVSYRKNDDSIEKAKIVYDRLTNTKGDPVHASPLEHQATPMIYAVDFMASYWQEGITHVDRKGKFSEN